MAPVSTRSRSPRRRTWGVATSALAFAKSLLARVPEGRRKALAVSLLTVLEKYTRDPADLEGLGLAICEQVDLLGGLVRKAAQQVSQLPDVVPEAVLRHGLQGLQGRNTPRGQFEIEEQLTLAFPDATISVLSVLGTGCMGEVSRVLVLGDIDGLPPPTSGSGVVCAAKTANFEQQRLFEQDFELFASLNQVLSIPLQFLRRINNQVAQELEAVVSKITDMANNGELVSSVRNGFDMAVEEEHSRRGAEVLRRAGRGVFFAPEIYASSEGALLMELIDGELLEQQRTPPEFVGSFVVLYVEMLREGYLHQDSHPANMIFPRSANGSTCALIDWGEVVEIPEVHREDTRVLFRTVVAGHWMGAEHDSLRELFQRLGVVVKPDRVVLEDAYTALANMLNVVQVLRGDPQVSTVTLIGATVFQAPGWLEAWQKATNAFAVSLQAVGASPETVDDELRKVLGLPPCVAALG